MRLVAHPVTDDQKTIDPLVRGAEVARLADEEVPRFRPRERFWPYVDVPEQPTPEELAALDPDLRAALDGGKADTGPFSVTIVFPPFDSPDYAQAVALARGSAEYREVRRGDTVLHRARYFAADVHRLRQLWQLVERLNDAEVLVNDRAVPYARELWLPLIWFLLLE